MPPSALTSPPTLTQAPTLAPLPDRLHALDAVRASALILGVALHGAQPFISGLPWMVQEAPSTALAAAWFTIHLFRMPLFFLIGGFFGRMVLERRGVRGFIKDRSRRILVPLVVGVPTIMLLTGLAYMAGGWIVGADARGLAAPPASARRNLLDSINLMHLWFLYYLLMFYVTVLGSRALISAVTKRTSRPSSAPDRRPRLSAVLDRCVSVLVRSGSGPLLLALPAAAWYFRLRGWSPWGGLPAPFSLQPDVGAVLAYGSFFTFGWLLNRQQSFLASLEQRWMVHGAVALAAWAICRVLAGATPHWGPILSGLPLAAYTVCYVGSAWSGSFALIGVALRFLPDLSPVRRYLAEASYWIYLLHIAVLLFFEQILHPLHWPAILKYAVSIAGAMSVLLLSYHGLVRFTFIGEWLNGKGHRRVRGTDRPLQTVDDPSVRTR